MQTITLFTGATANGTQAVNPIDNGAVPARPNRVYQSTVSGTGAVTATVTLFGSADGTNFSATPFGTITLSGTTTVTDNFASGAAWPYVRCTVANVSGTGATVSTVVAL